MLIGLVGKPSVGKSTFFKACTLADVDIAPYPIDWEDTKRFALLAGIVIGIDSQLKQNKLITYDIRWGGDWDGDNDLNDQKFNDLGHFELV